MSDTSEATPVRTCATCGQVKPVTDFDRRFINKGTRLTCALCRAARYEHEDLRMQQAIAAARERQLERERQWQEQLAQWKQRLEERRQLEEEWSRHAERQGFSGHDKTLIVHIHLSLREAKASWDDIKRRFRELEPPYIGRVMDPHTGRATRERIYAQQDGRCFYCGRELLPLDVFRQPGMARAATMSREEAKAGGYAIRYGHMDSEGEFTGMVTVRRILQDDSALPELDHRVPISRGGGHTLDNLCYACRECNQTKSIRTVEEFARYPHDPISEMGMAAGSVQTALEFEARGYEGFGDNTP